MIANIICITVIAGWVALVILSMVRDWKRAKREGTPMACFSCGAYKSHSCDHHCATPSDVDKMIEAAKETLAAKKQQA